jgi:hypothetical protein
MSRKPNLSHERVPLKRAVSKELGKNIKAYYSKNMLILLILSYLSLKLSTALENILKALIIQSSRIFCKYDSSSDAHSDFVRISHIYEYCYLISL